MLWSSSERKLVWTRHSYSRALCHLVSLAMMPLALSYRHLSKHFLTWGGWWDQKSRYRSVSVGCHHPFRVGCQGMRVFHPSRKHPKERLLKEAIHIEMTLTEEHFNRDMGFQLPGCWMAASKSQEARTDQGLNHNLQWHPLMNCEFQWHQVT